MSYDIELFRMLPSETPQAAFVRRVEAASLDEGNLGLADESKEALKRSLAAALIGNRPALTPFPVDYEEIAKQMGASLEAARRRWRHVELNEERLGLQVTLYDDSVTVAIAYWHKGEAAENAFRAIWQCIGIIRETTGYIAFDPQLDRTVESASDSDRIEAMQRYLSVKARVEREIKSGTLKKRPWWKFW